MAGQLLVNVAQLAEAEPKLEPVPIRHQLMVELTVLGSTRNLAIYKHVQLFVEMELSKQVKNAMEQQVCQTQITSAQTNANWIL